MQTRPINETYIRQRDSIFKHPTNRSNPIYSVTFELTFENHQVDTSDASYKRSLEYLFYGQDPRLPGEIMRVAEEGFRSSEYYGELGLDAAVALSNSMSIADIPRIADNLVRNGTCVNADGTPKNRIGLEVASGQLLITKVFLARCAADKDGKGEGEEGDVIEGGGSPLIDKGQYPKHDSVYHTYVYTYIYIYIGYGGSVHKHRTVPKT